MFTTCNSSNALFANRFETESTENSPDAWRRCPEVPSISELLRERVELPINVVDGPYSSVDDYLEAHYELLKEDAFAGLRESVCHMRQYPDAEDTNDLAVYDHVSHSFVRCLPCGIEPAINLYFIFIFFSF